MITKNTLIVPPPGKVTAPSGVQEFSFSPTTPDGIYLEADDFVVVNWWNRYGTAQTLTVNCALIAKGEKTIKDMSFDFRIPASTTTVIAGSGEFPLTSGTLIGWRVSTSGSPGRGQSFIRLQIRKSGGGGFSRIVFASNYVTNASPITRGTDLVDSTSGKGKVYTASIPGPPAGSAFNFVTIPQFVQIRFISASFLYTADATIADRKFLFHAFSQSGYDIFLSESEVPQPASTAYSYNIGNYTDVQKFGPFEQKIAFPDGIELQGGDTITFEMVNAQATDQYSAMAYSWEEWIDV